MKNKLIRSYQGNTFYLKGILAGLNDEDMLLSSGESNTIGWILGHIALGRGQVLKMLKVECDIAESEKVFDRGVEKRKDLKINLEETICRYSTRGEMLTEIIKSLNDDDLKRTLAVQLPAGGNDVETYLSMIAWHETFHIGQIDLIKAAVGKGGIK